MRRIFSLFVMIALSTVLMACGPQESHNPVELASFDIAEESLANARLIDVRDELQSFNWLDEADRMIALHQEQLDLTEAAYGNQGDWTAVAQNNMGVAHVIAGDPQLAIPFFQQALDRIKKSDTTHTLDHRYRLHANLGEAFLRMDDLTSAKVHFDAAIANPSPFTPAIVSDTQSGQRMMMVMPKWQGEYERDPARVLVAAGVVPSVEARETAIGVFYELLAILRTAEAPVIVETSNRYFSAMEAAHHPRSRFLTSANGNMEVVYFTIVYDPISATYSQRADIGESRLGYEHYTDAANLSTRMQNRVDVLAQKGEFEAAAALLLELKKNLEPLFPNDTYFLATYHVTLAGYHNLRGEVDLAGEHFKTAYESLIGKGRVRDLSELDYLELYAGHLVRSGRYMEGELLYEKGIADATAQDGTKSVLLTRMRSGYAKSLLSRGAYARSRLVLQSNLELIRDAGGSQPNLPVTYAALSQALLALGETREAIHMAERAFETAKDYVPQNSIMFDEYIRTLAEAYDAGGRHDDAYTLLSERLETHQDGPLAAQGRIYGMLAMSRHYRASGQFEKGAGIDRDIAASLQVADSQDMRPILTSAKLRQLEFDARTTPETAGEILTEATALLSVFPSSNIDGVFSFGQGMTAQRRAALVNVVNIAVSAGNDDAVFDGLQSLFADGVGYATRLSRERELADDPRVADLLRRRDSLNRERSRLRLDQFGEQAISAEDRAARVEKRGRLDADIQAVVEQLDAVSLGYEARTSLTVLRQQLSPNQAVLLIHSDIPVVMVVSRAKVASARINMTREELRDAVAALRTSTQADGNGLYPAYAEVEARRVYDAIFTPDISNILLGVDTILTQQGGRISTLPLSLLLNSDGDYLADHFAVRTVASLRGINRANNNLSGKFVGVGAPVLAPETDGARFGADAYILRGAADADAVSDLPPLPGAERELMALSGALDFDDVTLLIGSDATKARFRSLNFSNTAVLALATHGLVAGELDANSEPALVLTPDVDGTGGLLTMSEVMELDLDVGLVILSACNTAAGGEADAAGLTGLASAFIYSGADVLMASHWPVRDDAAEALSIATVRNMRGGVTPERALQNAINAFRASSAPQASHPGVWAPFIIVGE